ncbi:hypothetical protein [Longimicrobium terrae]|uniref:Uncharacterized protein n=1 Tax=Longimicrobium terrae TaxID=1639882 RepID=A0A841GXD4_9BACT|nr:hypothetical protein [Longimicrobium terrae]MBB4635632.1 hypothetical protein [Longimicrobium terrae]MBB6070026.1 hypothetical protein [Longimicrobium terrae]NNC32933.1 hypothetical protein [Longimicrobium terrae]
MPYQLFPLGVVTATPAALDQLERAGRDPMEFILRHAAGDHGEVGEDSVQINRVTIRVKVGTILSAYPLPDGETIWVSTSLQQTGEAHTCVMCPSEW